MTDERPILIVAGLGRCGTTMVMQMLAAGGVTCAGLPPAYEPREAAPFAFDPEWFRDQRGHAVKLINPFRIPKIEAPAIVIWCQRDLMEQAKSQIKFASTLLPLQVRSGAKEKMRRALADDQWRSLVHLSHLPMQRLQFENTIRDPIAAANVMIDFIAPQGFQLDARKAAGAVVTARTTRCLPGLLELEMQGGGPT